MTRQGSVVLGLLVLATAGAAHAQARPQRRVHLGVDGGLTFATWHGSDVGSGATRRTGIHAGATLTAKLNQGFSLRTGASYSQEGTGADLGAGVTGAIKVDYLRVPLYLEASTTLRGTTPLRPFLYAGPSFGFKVRCKVAAQSGGQSAEANCDDPSVGLRIKGTDLGLDFGAGVGIGRFSLGGRYQYGIRSIDDNGGNADVKNSTFAISAGYSF
jgi:outer membrane protein with beta-barrel domain